MIQDDFPDPLKKRPLTKTKIEFEEAMMSASAKKLKERQDYEKLTFEVLDLKL